MTTDASSSSGNNGAGSSTQPTFVVPAIPVLPSINQAFNIRLDRSNFLLWRTQMLNVVIANGLEEMVDETRPIP